MSGSALPLRCSTPVPVQVLNLPEKAVHVVITVSAHRQQAVEFIT